MSPLFMKVSEVEIYYLDVDSGMGSPTAFRDLGKRLIHIL